MSTLASISNKNEWPLKAFVSKYGLLALQLTALLIALKINRKIDWLWPSFWILFPASVSVILFRARLADEAKPVVFLWKLIGFFSAFYSLIHYPLIPLADSSQQAHYGLFLFVWMATTIAGFLCLRFPSLAILPPAFLLWSFHQAEAISGLPVTVDIDVRPLTEVSMCIGLGLVIDQVTRLVKAPTSDLDSPKFVALLFLLAIGVHLANYFWSFIAKVQLDNSPFLWLTENNPAALFLAALDGDHIVFAAYPLVVEWIYWLIDESHLLTNFLVLAIQGMALTAFFLPKRWLILLLIAFDVMHFSLIIVGGINFWPWIILNLIVAYVVSAHEIRTNLLLKLVATIYILVAPRFVSVTQLGWLDSGVNNKLSFEALDKLGGRHVVPTNFFTFYSYPFGHMDYGLPDPTIGFEVGSNGGVLTKRLLYAGRSCDVTKLKRQLELFPFKSEPFAKFVRNYHLATLPIYHALGTFPYDLYPHHFYVPLSVGESFRKLNKDDIVAYVYKQESVCLSVSEGRPRRKLVASTEFRIDVDADQ